MFELGGVLGVGNEIDQAVGEVFRTGDVFKLLLDLQLHRVILHSSRPNTRGWCHAAEGRCLIRDAFCFPEGKHSVDFKDLQQRDERLQYIFFVVYNKQTLTAYDFFILRLQPFSFYGRLDTAVGHFVLCSAFLLTVEQSDRTPISLLSRIRHTFLGLSTRQLV
jgi:hypothetical protein